jgi:hypothetical protein
MHEDDPGPTKKAYNFARSLSMADGGGRALAICTQGAVPHAKKAGSITTPGEVSLDAKPCVKA